METKKNKISERNQFSKKRLKALDDHDIPVVAGESIEEFENRTGRGFYGNQTTGYVHKKDTE